MQVLYISKRTGTLDFFKSIKKLEKSTSFYLNEDQFVQSDLEASEYSIIVVDNPTHHIIDKITNSFPRSSILVIEEFSNQKEIIPAHFDELLYVRLDENFKRIFTKALFRVYEQRALSRQKRLFDSLFENVDIPIIISRKSRSTEECYIESYNNAFESGSLINKRIKLGNQFCVFDLYKLTKAEAKAANEGAVKILRKSTKNGITTEVDVYLIENRISSSNTIFQFGFEVERRQNFTTINQLTERLEFLEEKKRSQTEYLASIVHDLKRPLNNIIGLVDIINFAEPADEQEYILNSVRESSRNLRGLINDLLDISKIDSGKFEINNEYFEIRPFIKKLENLFEKDAKDKGIDFDVAIDESLPVWLDGDQNRLSQIIVNLLTNALKFTKKGLVKLELNTEQIHDDKVDFSITVSDSGIGISKENQEIIFDSYSQANPNIKAIYGGTGLGLSICKKLTELMGGQIYVDSDLGAGSKFTVRLSLKNAAIKENGEEAESSAQKLNGKSILVVDDNEVALFVIAKLITKNGGIVTSAFNGYDALNLFKTNHFDLVITDVQLPDFNGIRLGRKIKSEAEKQSKYIPIIGLSAFPFPNKQHGESYFDFFGLKPIKSSTLINQITNQLKKAQKAEIGQMLYRIIDIKHIQEFTGGDPVFIKQLVEIFLKRTPEYMDELKDAVNNQDWQRIKTMAHKVKPTFTYVGMASFTNKVGAIEDFAIKHEIEPINNILDEVWDDCQLAFDEFKGFVESLE